MRVGITQVSAGYPHYCRRSVGHRTVGATTHCPRHASAVPPKHSLAVRARDLCVQPQDRHGLTISRPATRSLHFERQVIAVLTDPTSPVVAPTRGRFVIICLNLRLFYSKDLFIPARNIDVRCKKYKV